MKSAVLAAIALLSSAASADALSAAHELGVRTLSLQDLAPVEARGGDGVMLSVELDGRSVVLDLEPRSYRSDSFRLILADGDEQAEVAAPAPRTFAGTIAGDATSSVAGSIIDGEAKLMILTDGGRWAVQPVAGEGEGVHAVYNQRDLLPHDGACILEDAGAPLFDLPALPGRPTFAPRGGTEGVLDLAEIAIDTDWEFYDSIHNQDQQSLLDDVESIVAGFSAVYERDVLLTYELTAIVVRTSPSDPYTTSNPSGLLSQFRNHWNSSQGSIQRDMAHLFTGRNMDGSTIGIAYLGTVCGSSAYGVDQIRFSANYNSRVALFAHEAGHNWNANHCDGASQCNIMCSGLNGCDGIGIPNFAQVSINRINSFINSRPCLGMTNVGLPIFEQFTSTELQPPAWASSTDFEVAIDFNCPSPFGVGRFQPGTTSIETNEISTVVSPGGTVSISMWTEPQSAQAGEMRVFADPVFGASRLVGIIPAHDPSDGYVRSAFQLPGDLLNTGVEFMFEASAGGPEFYVDDMELSEVSSTDATISLPFGDGFERAALFLDGWQPSPAEVNDDDAATGAYSLALDSGQRVETADALGGEGSGIYFGVLARSPAGAAGNAELVIEYRNAGGSWVEVDRVAASAVSSSEFELVEVELPAGAAHDALSVAMEIDGGASPEAWRIDDLELGDDPRGDGDDCPADLAAPFGVLDLADIAAFTTAFVAGDPIADLVAPFGVLDLGDVQAFVASFVAGCP